MRGEAIAVHTNRGYQVGDTHTHTQCNAYFLKNLKTKSECVGLKNGLSHLLRIVGQPSKCPVNYVIFVIGPLGPLKSVERPAHGPTAADLRQAACNAIRRVAFFLTF